MRPGIAYSPRLKDVLTAAAIHYRRHEDGPYRTLLEEAVDLAPQRIDLWFALASHHIQTGSPDTAIDIYRELSRTVVDDVDTLFCLAHWLRHAGGEAEARETRRRLGGIRPESADDLQTIWSCLDVWLEAEVSDAVPGGHGHEERLAIVTLGYVLNPDGGMAAELTDRLQKTLEVADAFPGSMIVVSGGVPRSGKVEAVEMRRWLVDMGVDRGRVFEEGYARDVVENLLYSRQILDIVGVDAVVLVTSAVDVRRAGAGMEIAGWRNGSSWRVTAVAAGGKSLAQHRENASVRLKLYRDTLRAYGMPMLRSYPELAEL